MSNTTDSYVPLLARHEYTSGGCSNGSHEQPSFNLSNAEAFTETWEGYIKVDADIENCVLKVSADDNACFFLYAFPDHKAELLPRGPQGGGGYTDATSTPIPQLKKGYYRAKVTYENIDYSGTNLARLDVLLNGNQIAIGNLTTHNTLTASAAQNLLDQYVENVSYSKGKEEIWALFGPVAVQKYGQEHSCATRVSIALSRAGYTLTGAKNANGTNASNNVENMGWDISILNSDGGTTHKHVVISAYAMSQLFFDLFGEVDYENSDDYENILDSTEVYRPKAGDVVIFGDSLHVGICPGNDPSVASFMCGSVRILYRASWEQTS